MTTADHTATAMIDPLDHSTARRRARLSAKLTKLGQERARLRSELKQVNEQLKRTVIAALDAGMAELKISKLAQITRMAVRTWNGKRTWEGQTLDADGVADHPVDVDSEDTDTDADTGSGT